MTLPILTFAQTDKKPIGDFFTTRDNFCTYEKDITFDFSRTIGELHLTRANLLAFKRRQTIRIHFDGFID